MAQARRKSKKSLARTPLALDPWLLGAALALAGLGVVMVASASLAIAENAGMHPMHYATKHIIALGLGVVLGSVCLRIPMSNLERASPFLMLLSFPLLMLVFVPGIGVTVNGSTRWIRTGMLNFQVVEAVKLMTAVYLSGYLVRQSAAVQQHFLGTFKPLAVAGLIALLLLAQPDFGGAVLILGMTVAMVWQAGSRLRDMAAVCIMALPMMIWSAFSESYRAQRLKTFLDPWADPFDGGFQLTQALIAIGRGEWLGVGLGGSVQKLFYLPEAHTDFILAVLAEELGLFGILCVLGLFAVLVGRGLLVALRALQLRQHFSGFLAFGLSFLLGLQVIISVGVNFGVLPTKGLTLPLISSGGSSAMMTCVLIALLLRVAHENKDSAPARATQSPSKSPGKSSTRPSRKRALRSSRKRGGSAA